MILAGVTLAGHAAWDLVHYRRNAVVHRSLAEFCMLWTCRSVSRWSCWH